jgi:hypothetical protein
VDEISRLVERHHPPNIHFFDDVFTVNRKRLDEIARLVRDRGLHEQVSFSCAVRAESTDESLIAALKSMNVVRLTFGAESNSAPVLSYLKGGAATPESNQKAVDLAWAAGMDVGLSFIKGSPGESLRDVFETYDFVLRNVRARKIDQAAVNDLVPFPGTEVWDLAKARGLVSETMNWDELKNPWRKQYLNDRMPFRRYLTLDLLSQRVIRCLAMGKKRLLCMLVVPASCSPELKEQVVARVLEVKHSRFFDALSLVAERHEAETVCRAVSEATGVAVGSPAGLESFDLVALVYAEGELRMGDLEGLVWHHLEKEAHCTVLAETALPPGKGPTVFSVATFKCMSAVYGGEDAGVVAGRGGPPRPRVPICTYHAASDPFRGECAAESVYRADMSAVAARMTRDIMKVVSWLYGRLRDRVGNLVVRTGRALKTRKAARSPDPRVRGYR